MTSPMQSAQSHDVFVLLDGAKEWRVPGLARVQAGLSANTDEASVPGGEDQVAQLQEASGEVRVSITITEHADYVQYASVLARLRRGTQDGPAVFACAHPEVRARRIKRLYFQSEQADPYRASTGYQAVLTFKESLKAKAPVTNTDGAGGGFDFLVPPPAASLGTTQDGAAILTAARANLLNTPRGVGIAGQDTSSPGLCSAWTRTVWQDTHGGDRRLFGGSAVQTEQNFKKAGMHLPWTLNAQRQLQAGDLVFYGNDPSGFGHVGVYDGQGGVLGNNLVTYRKNGGVFDAAGRPTGRDAAGRKVDARGTVPIGSLGTPTGIGKPAPVTAGPVVVGPAAPLPPQRPSLSIPGPR